MYKASHWCSLATFHGLKLLRTKVYFSFSSLHVFFSPVKQLKSLVLACAQIESSGSGNLWQTQDQSPLLPSKVPSLELRLTQLRNIIAFKAHLNLFITIIHSPELSNPLHQSHYSVKTELNGWTLFMNIRSNIIRCVNGLLSIYLPKNQPPHVWLLYSFAIHCFWSRHLCNSVKTI